MKVPQQLSGQMTDFNFSHWSLLEIIVKLKHIGVSQNSASQPRASQRFGCARRDGAAYTWALFRVNGKQSSLSFDDYAGCGLQEHKALLRLSLLRAAPMRRAAWDTRAGRPTGRSSACTVTVTAPAQVPFGHHTGAETQHIPSIASWWSITVARGSRMDLRRLFHSRGVQQSGNVKALRGRVAYSTRPVAVRAINSGSTWSGM